MNYKNPRSGTVKITSTVEIKKLFHGDLKGNSFL